MASTTSFGERLAKRIAEYGPLCIGLDPSREVLEAWGQPQSAVGLEGFMADVIDRVPESLAAVKPQVAFFERFGATGWRILEDSVHELRQRGFLVILDAKRSDIGSSVEGYAEAYFGEGPLRVDAITASPYLGVDALNPLFESAASLGCGVFVLCRTSNLEGRGIQDHCSVDGRPIWEDVQDAVAKLNPGPKLGSVGLVMGATLTDRLERFDLHNGPILAPGFGHQGATADSFAKLFRTVTDRTLASYSRSLLLRGPTSFAASVFGAADEFREAMAHPHT